MQMTSAYANKMLRSLDEDKAYWLEKEATSCMYTAAVNEEPVVPEYDYLQVAGEIEEIDRKTCIIKHALNLANATAQIQVGKELMSVDMILVKMAQLNRRKGILDGMRKQLPKTRVQQMGYGARTAVAEYRYINYDLDLVKAEYENISGQLMEMQIALDRHNQTELFEVAL